MAMLVLGRVYGVALQGFIHLGSCFFFPHEQLQAMTPTCLLHGTNIPPPKFVEFPVPPWWDMYGYVASLRGNKLTRSPSK